MDQCRPFGRQLEREGEGDPFLECHVSKVGRWAVVCRCMQVGRSGPSRFSGTTSSKARHERAPDALQAYTLMQRLRALALHATELERASAATIRVRLLKIGAAIVRNTRRVRGMLASHHPLREIFAVAAARLAALSP
jgi:hypothetical protein